MLVETQSLTKRYGHFTALDDCTFGVREGEVLGLLGPNGAGKTTLIRILLGFLRPTEGFGRIRGFDCFRQSVRVRQQVAYLPAEAKLFRRMRAEEVLRFFAAIRGASGNVQRSRDLAQRLDLDIRCFVAQMSTGMRQKLALATALAHDTPVLILDEPTANLDPNVRRVVMEILTELRQEGRTLLLCSHVLSEIEEMCDRVVILRQGQIVHVQPMAALRQRHRIRGRLSNGKPQVPDRLASMIRLQHEDEFLHMETDGELSDILPWLAELELTELAIEPIGLRSVYDRFHAPEGGA